MPLLQNKKILHYQNNLHRQHLDYISICLTLGIIMLFAILSRDNKIIIFNTIKSPIIISIILIVCLTIGYYHFLSSMLLLILVIFLFLQDNYAFCLDSKYKIKNNTNTIQEGFISKERMEELDKIDETEGLKVSDTKIKELFKPGFFGKKLAEAREKNKAQYEATLAKNKAMMALEKKKKRIKAELKNRRGEKANEDIEKLENVEDFEDLEENFSDNLDNTNNGRKSTKAILRRKFDPTNEEDSNLLLTMEACAEIQDRIKYNYENKEYLKRYIRDKLEEIIELLQLINDE